jgi:type I thyroxine 5'-deiodinase
MGSPDGSVVEEPIGIEERCENARRCKAALGLGDVPALIDSLEGEADRAYEAWPDRMVLIDADGRVAWRSAPGPFGFDPAELRAALQQEVNRVRALEQEADAEDAATPEPAVDAGTEG